MAKKTKTVVVDAEGRVKLGKLLAGRTVIVDDTNPQKITVDVGDKSVDVGDKSVAMGENDLATDQMYIFFRQLWDPRKDKHLRIIKVSMPRDGKIIYAGVNCGIISFWGTARDNSGYETRYFVVTGTTRHLPKIRSAYVGTVVYLGVASHIFECNKVHVGGAV